MTRHSSPEIKLPLPCRPAPRRTRTAAGLCCRALLLASAVIGIGWLNSAPNAAIDPDAAALPYPGTAPKDEWVANAFAPLPWIQYTVQHDDTLSGIFTSLGLDGHDAVQIAALNNARPLRQLRPGQSLRLRMNAQHDLAALELDLDALSSLDVAREGGTFQASRVQHPHQAVRREVSGRVEGSLFEAGVEAGLPDHEIMQLVAIFKWNIDFAKDIKAGDQFAVIYNELYRGGELVDTGDILAAEIQSNGRWYRAVRFQSGNGKAAYYTPDGHSLKRAFLRTPVPFSRVTSGFSLRRYHPILKKWRSHKGVDYGAPRGTPVYATSIGQVSFVGRKGGYGNAVILQHAGHISTLYGHLSRFRRGLKRGQRVTQGETIGYVGSTGLATGPHLHYEFRVNGVHRNPLTVKLPNAAPIEAAELNQFRHTTRQLVADLNELREVRVAAAGGR